MAQQDSPKRARITGKQLAIVVVAAVVAAFAGAAVQHALTGEVDAAVSGGVSGAIALSTYLAFGRRQG